MDQNLEYKILMPDQALVDFVEQFWFLKNHSQSDIETTGLPDGLVDIILSKSTRRSFHIIELGGLTEPENAKIPAGCVMFCISFKLLAVEYILKQPISDILNSGRFLPDDFWGFAESDFLDFENFVNKASNKIKSLLPGEIDERKRKLFNLVYKTHGNITISEVSEKVCWNPRQINRYFNQQFGISLKAYCTILRFRASLNHIANGTLSPEESYFDQNHFIRDVKKFSGVVPKELSKNKNDRFILLSAIKHQ